MIDIDADYAIAQVGTRNQLAADIADDEQTFERAAHAAAEVAANRMSLAGKTREDRYADAGEIRAEARSLEDEDLANDLATEQETRQNAYATADAGWLAAEAAAEIASTTISALGTKNLINNLVAAEVAYITAANPLLTTATQTFHNLIDVAYVAAYGGDVDQTAVSGAWTMYHNTLATEAQTATTTATTAYQIYMNGLATDIETMFNDIASEATARATDIGIAVTNYVSTVAAAATLETSQSATAGVAWVDTVATDEKNAVKNMATAWQQQANDDAAATTVQADDYSASWNTFTHSSLTALTPHQTNLINEDRVAQQSANTELTTLAQGAANEQFNLIDDDLTEQKTAALALSPLDDLVTNAWSVLESASSITYAWMTHASTASAPPSNFQNSWPGGYSPMSTINHTFDLAANNDEVVMAAAVAATSQSTWDWWSPSTWTWSEFMYGLPKNHSNAGMARHNRTLIGLGSTAGTQQLHNGTAFDGGAGGAVLDHTRDMLLNGAGQAAGIGMLRFGDEAVDAANALRRGRTVNNVAGHLAGPVGRMADHHIFPVQFKSFFSSRGVDIDSFTVTVEHQITHLRGIHGGGNMGQFPGRWNQLWQGFIDVNPNATAKDVYQFGGKLIDDFGLGHLPVHPFRK
jgi:hypothetical protein